MKTRVWFLPVGAALLILFLSLWGCGDISVLTALKAAELAARTHYFLYVTNYGDGTVSSYSMDSSTGALTSLGAPIGSGLSPDIYSDVVDTSGKFLYVVNADAGGNGLISAFTINPISGVLNYILGSGVSTGIYPNYMAVDPLDRFLYAVNYVNVAGPSTVSAYTINSSTGMLSPSGAAAATGNGPLYVAVDTTGSFVYVANTAGVSGYTINTSNGTLTQMGSSPFTNVLNAFGIAVDPVGNFVFVTNNALSTVSTFTKISGGALNFVTGSGAATGTGPQGVAVDPSGRFAYVINHPGLGVTGSVSAYTINPSTGVLSPNGAAIAAGIEPYCVVVDPSGKFVYVANFTRSPTPGTVSAYSIDSTGVLHYINQYTTGVDPSYIAIAKVVTGP